MPAKIMQRKILVFMVRNASGWRRKALNIQAQLTQLPQLPQLEQSPQAPQLVQLVQFPVPQLPQLVQPLQLQHDEQVAHVAQVAQVEHVSQFTKKPTGPWETLTASPPCVCPIETAVISNPDAVAVTPEEA